MDHLSREKEKFASVIGETGSFGTLFFVFSSSGWFFLNKLQTVCQIFVLHCGVYEQFAETMVLIAHIS